MNMREDLGCQDKTSKQEKPIDGHGGDGISDVCHGAKGKGQRGGKGREAALMSFISFMKGWKGKLERALPHALYTRIYTLQVIHLFRRIFARSIIFAVELLGYIRVATLVPTTSFRL